MKTLILIFVLLITTCLYSTIINVPGDQPTIQAGIDVATDTDTVLVADGTYFENIDFIGKAITVASNFLINADTLHITNTIINGSQPINPDHGSVVTFISNEDTTSVLTGFTITEGTGNFYPGYGYCGGGIMCDNSSPKIVSNIITNNSADYAGGVDCSYNSPILLNNVISYNTATVNIGGLCLYESSNAHVEGNIISNNSAQGHVGGVSIEESSPTLINNIIENNTSNINSGGVMILNSSPSLVSNIIRDNSALTGQGGGVSILYDSNPVLLNNIICDNTAGTYGGGIRISGNSNAILSYTSIYGNTASADGGGIYCVNSNPVITYCTIIDNTADISGGGIACESSSPQILNCTIINNNSLAGTGIAGGGGIACLDSSPEISNCTINGNTANYPGGGIALANSDGIIEYCDIMGNTTEHSGGGIACFNSNATISYCLITDNNAITWEGGGIDAWDYSNFTVINCTVSGNDAGGNGGGIKSSQFSDMTMKNTIIEGNTGSEGVYFSDPGNVDITYSDFYNNVVGDFGGSVPPDLGIITTVNANGDPCDVFMNIFLDPLFEDPASGNFQILEDSPCVDAGDPMSLPDPDGTIVDIGRFYFDQTGTNDNIIVQKKDYLHQNYPNPFNPETTISYQLPENGKVELTVYNLKGQKVKTLVNEVLPAGEHSIVWDGIDDNGKSVSSGIYFYKLKTENHEETKKMILMK
ncbi:MAG: right-handed parallel beta-helix repeat-containing protein [Candidatus Cloacimonetes bacterium]|nr:right-handed parallel beta-helix repeat-containing protein [Candidatus Cloacimonadota bacterium]